MEGNFPTLGTEKVLKGFPDLESERVLKAFPDIEIGQVLKIHRDELGDPHDEGDNLSLVILGPLPGDEGLRIGSVIEAPEAVEATALAEPEALGAVDVTVLADEGDWAVIVSVAEIRGASDD
ncbi:hypothetical protein ABT304_29010 [Nocardioides sp. NPDC000445]|uniref:hypothetical protein n=1 Tax=Nocardioides sp. NPDC000445 TaxID=3154257 RepID=UPI00331DB5B2